jgi:lysophospholipase L1-like esterase
MIPSRSILAAALVAVLAAPTAAQAAKRPAPKSSAVQYYVSLGDSYATGYQPAPDGGLGHGTRNGYAYRLPALARRRGYRYKLVNLGCGGATTRSILHQVGCPPIALGPGAAGYPGTTQVAAAERFLRRWRASGRVGLVTVSIGGNDVTACARAANAVTCTAGAVGIIDRNVGSLVRRLRRAAGPKVRIVGITYPDVILGQWIRPGGQELARLSVVAFQALINPALKRAYESVGGSFVDVTAATGAYGSLDATTTLAPYGTIPVPVARVCELTYYCSVGDIHATAPGYGLIAQLIARTLPLRRAGVLASAPNRR